MFMQLAKGSIGFQIGAEEIDLVLMAMNQAGIALPCALPRLTRTLLRWQDQDFEFEARTRDLNIPSDWNLGF